MWRNGERVDAALAILRVQFNPVHNTCESERTRASLNATTSHPGVFERKHFWKLLELILVYFASLQPVTRDRILNQITQECTYLVI